MAPENERPKAEPALIVIDRLRLASWLYINHQRLVERKLDPQGQHITYCFEASNETASLVEQWIQKRGLVDLATLAKFSNAVSFEIRVAARLRRGEDVSELQEPRRLNAPRSPKRATER